MRIIKARNPYIIEDLYSMDNGKDEAKEEDEEIEEEMIVFANFEEGTIDREILRNSDLKFKVIGLDSETPIVQLGGHTFKGTWNDTIGTKIFFNEDVAPDQVDPVFTVLPPKMLKYKCMSTKTLELSRIFLKSKSSFQKRTDENNVKIINKTNSAEVSHLIQSTINPDSDVIEIMNNIVAETVMEI